MVEDLCFHLHDLVQNSAAAGAKNISVTISDRAAKDLITMTVEDDGEGMDRQTLGKVQDPFFTSKSFKKVGLGIPLLKATAQSCRGDFRIRSRVGHGTKVSARLQKSHVDCPPLGDLMATLLSLLVGFDRINIRFAYQSDNGAFALASADIRRQVGDLHFSHPEIHRFLKGYIHEGLGRVLIPHA
ncbi:MAG TPA: ATP-binding protein [Patescibacteria group bacterium]|nr:ATP-binding protein [Patescibacteria group bacterium]